MAGIGEALRSTRERRGLSIAEVAQDTRISPRFLEALESEQFDELPAPVYVRGFIRSYASYLKIESQPLLDQLVGGNGASGPAPGGYVGGRANGNGNGAGPRRNDPFQRHGVVSAKPKPTPAASVAAEPVDSDAWAPEPPAPFVPAPVDRGYIPGSDLMEAPESHDFDYEYEPQEAVPVYRTRSAGILAERPPSGGEPGVPRRVALFGGAVAAVLLFLALAVFLTRDDDGDGVTNAAGNDPTVGLTPGTVIPVSSRTTTPASASASASASAAASASTTGTAAATTTPSNTTPSPTSQPGTPTATSTPTTAPTSAPTPTATPTNIPPTPAPTVGAPPHPSTIAACDISKESDKCGSAYVRVICFPPFAEADPTGKNNNYFVDVTGAYPLQAGWRETTVYAPVSIGPVIEAGRNSCL